MNNIEYACYDYSINETETQANILKAIDLGAKSIAVSYFSLSTVKNITKIENQNISVSCLLDFPYGLSDNKSRIFMATQIVKQKQDIKFLDIMMPTKTITNRKYDKLREEIKNLVELCGSSDIKIRYILEYRVYNHEVIAKVCQILQEFGVDTVFPSTGIMIDNIEDNLIACNFLKTKTGIKTICTGNLYTNHHVRAVKNMTNLDGMRFFYLAGLELFNKISI